MTEAQLTNREKEMLAGTSEEKIIYRLKCVHHKVCGYMCTQVCPYRDTAKSDAVLECQWEENEEYGYWETGCKATFEFIEGDMDDNSFKFCPYCGGKIKELRQHKER